MSFWKPYKYQEQAERFLLERKSAALFLDMGLGKTAITLSAVKKLIDDFAAFKVLVIAPLEPAKKTWPAELGKWDSFQSLSFSLVLGDQKSRLAALEQKADVYIINQENVVWLVEHYKKRWPFDTVIIDELSSFKSSKSARFRALKRVKPYIKRVYGLTGTPAPNGLVDLWSQVYLLDCGGALGKTKTGYLQKYFTPDKRNATTIFSWRVVDEKAIYDRVSHLCLSMKSEDYLELPERLNVFHEVDFPEEQYKHFKQDTILTFPDGDIDAPSAGVLANKLLQFCAGRVYDENGSVKEIHNGKFEKLEQLIAEANGKPVIVFYAYKHEKAEIQKLFPKAVDVKSDGAQERWNSGEIEILLAHPKSAGHGLNLQFGGSTVIWFTTPWSLELYQQANKRLHRLGQKNTVLIHHIITKSGVDKRMVQEVLVQKDKRQNDLINALKAEVYND